MNDCATPTIYSPSNRMLQLENSSLINRSALESRVQGSFWVAEDRSPMSSGHCFPLCNGSK